MRNQTGVSPPGGGALEDPPARGAPHTAPQGSQQQLGHLPRFSDAMNSTPSDYIERLAPTTYNSSALHGLVGAAESPARPAPEALASGIRHSLSGPTHLEPEPGTSCTFPRPIFVGLLDAPALRSASATFASVAAPRDLNDVGRLPSTDLDPWAITNAHGGVRSHEFEHPILRGIPISDRPFPPRSRSAAWEPGFLSVVAGGGNAGPRSGPGAVLPSFTPLSPKSGAPGVETSGTPGVFCGAVLAPPGSTDLPAEKTYTIPSVSLELQTPLAAPLGFCLAAPPSLHPHFPVPEVFSSGECVSLHAVSPRPERAQPPELRSPSKAAVDDIGQEDAEERRRAKTREYNRLAQARYRANRRERKRREEEGREASRVALQAARVEHAALLHRQEILERLLTYRDECIMVLESARSVLWRPSRSARPAASLLVSPAMRQDPMRALFFAARSLDLPRISGLTVGELGRFDAFTFLAREGDVADVVQPNDELAGADTRLLVGHYRYLGMLFAADLSIRVKLLAGRIDIVPDGRECQLEDAIQPLDLGQVYRTEGSRGCASCVASTTPAFVGAQTEATVENGRLVERATLGDLDVGDGALSPGDVPISEPGVASRPEAHSDYSARPPGMITTASSAPHDDALVQPDASFIGSSGRTRSLGVGMESENVASTAAARVKASVSRVSAADGVERPKILTSLGSVGGFPALSKTRPSVPCSSNVPISDPTVPIKRGLPDLPQASSAHMRMLPVPIFPLVSVSSQAKSSGQSVSVGSFPSLSDCDGSTCDSRKSPASSSGMSAALMLMAGKSQPTMLDAMRTWNAARAHLLESSARGHIAHTNMQILMRTLIERRPEAIAEVFRGNDHEFRQVVNDPRHWRRVARGLELRPDQLSTLSETADLVRNTLREIVARRKVTLARLIEALKDSRGIDRFLGEAREVMRRGRVSNQASNDANTVDAQKPPSKNADVCTQNAAPVRLAADEASKSASQFGMEVPFVSSSPSLRGAASSTSCALSQLYALQDTLSDERAVWMHVYAKLHSLLDKRQSVSLRLLSWPCHVDLAKILDAILLNEAGKGRERRTEAPTSPTHGHADRQSTDAYASLDRQIEFDSLWYSLEEDGLEYVELVKRLARGEDKNEADFLFGEYGPRQNAGFLGDWSSLREDHCASAF